MTGTPQTDSRLLNSSHSPLEVCDVDHVGFDKASAFILSCYSTGDSPHGNDNANYKLQWQRAGGSFADVGADTEIAWGDSTDFTPNITDENQSVTYDANCLTATDHVQNVGNNAVAGAMSAPNGVLHLQFGLKFGSGALDGQEYEFQLVQTDDTISAICSVSITTAAGETTAYKDITLKTSLESALTYKDITLKTTLESINNYKDITLKTSLSAAPLLDYKDITLKTSLDSLDYKDITLKTSLHSLDYKDISLKTSLESVLIYKDVSLKTTLESALTYKDISLKTSLTEFVYVDYKDITLKTTLDALDYKDIALKTSLDSAPSPPALVDYIVSIQHFDITIPTGVTGNSANMDSETVVENCVPFMTYQSNQADGFLDTQILDVFFTEGSPPTITVKRANTTFSADEHISVFVVEFDGINVDVQQGTYEMIATIDADQVAITEVDLTKTAAVFGTNFASGSYDNVLHIFTKCFFSDSTHIDFERYGTGSIVSGHWYLFEAQGTEFTVEPFDFSIAEGQLQGNSVISSVAMERTMILASWEVNEADDHADQGSCRIWLEDSTHVYAERGTSIGSGVLNVSGFVIQFNAIDGVSVQRGAFNMGSSDTTDSEEITAVIPEFSIINNPSNNSMGESDSNAGTSFGANFVEYNFTDSDTIDAERGNHGNSNVQHNWEVIDFTTEAAPPTTYKDITLKTSLESIPIYKDIAVKTSLDILDFKDVALKISINSAATFKDITLKTTLESALTYKDITLKTSLESSSTYKDIVLKTTLDSLDYKDIALKISLLLKNYKDVAIKTSLESLATTDYKDITLKTTLESALTYKDITLKTTLDSLAYKDIALKTSLLLKNYKDVAIKTSLESEAITAYKDITLKTSLESNLTYKDIALKTSLESVATYKDISLKVSLESSSIYKDISLKTTLDSLNYKDIILKTSLEGLKYKDITIKISLELYIIPTDYKDITLKVSLEAITKEIINFTSSINQTEEITSSINQIENFISKIDS